MGLGGIGELNANEGRTLDFGRGVGWWGGRGGLGNRIIISG